MTSNVQDWLRKLQEVKGSDLFVTVGAPPCLKVHGRIQPLARESLHHDDVVDIINGLIIKLQRELKVTSIVVTHDMNSAYKIADRIVMLYDGRVIADGTPDQIRHSDDPIVRGFVEGRANPEDPVGMEAPLE